MTLLTGGINDSYEAALGSNLIKVYKPNKILQKVIDQLSGTIFTVKFDAHYNWHQRVANVLPCARLKSQKTLSTFLTFD